jgi:hypothetical protein
MRSTTLPTKKKQTGSLLDRFKDAKPEGGLPIFKFEEPGDAVVAKFLRRRPVKTKMGDGNALDLDIIECSDGETVGPHSTFESGHITRIFDSHNLNPGDRFFLRLHEIDAKNKFKRFAFELIDGGGNPPSDDEIPF